MAKVTLSDLVNKNPAEVVQKIQEKETFVPATTEATSVPAAETSAPAEKTPKTKKKLEYDRSKLKGLFKPESEFTKGQKITLEDHELEVLGVEKSAGRVKFKASNTDEVFSVSFSDLFGQQKEMPFKKGDTVYFKGAPFVVKGLNPASQNVVLEIEGKLRYVKLNKVSATPVVIEAALAPAAA